MVYRPRRWIDRPDGTQSFELPFDHDPHVCRCKECEPLNVGDYVIPRTGPDQFAVRFNDFRRVGSPVPHFFLNDVEIPHVVEAACGESTGMILFHRHPIHACRTCGRGGCRDIKWGNVRVEAELPRRDRRLD